VGRAALCRTGCRRHQQEPAHAGPASSAAGIPDAIAPALRAADKLVAAAHLLLRQSMWEQLLLRNPHNKLLRLYLHKKRASSYRGILDRIDTELYLTGALIFDW
jgi:hypothetical protein